MGNELKQKKTAEKDEMERLKMEIGGMCIKLVHYIR